MALGLITLGAAGRTQAKIPPMPQRDLESRSQYIVHGEVVSTTLVKVALQRPRWRGSYQSKVKVLSVEKGALKPGQVITLDWGVVRWVGPGRQPPGHWDYPTFRPCERFQAYLYRGKAAYTLMHYNGKRCAPPCAAGKLPDKAGKTVRCGKKKAR